MGSGGSASNDTCPSTGAAFSLTRGSPTANSNGWCASGARHGCHEAGTGRRQRAIDSMGAVQPPPIRPPLVPLSTRPVGPLGPAKSQVRGAQS